MFITTAALLATVVRGAAPAPSAADTACQVLLPKEVPVAGRKSPLDSLTFDVGGRAIKICYGRPSSRGRTMIGGAQIGRAHV